MHHHHIGRAAFRALGLVCTAAVTVPVAVFYGLLKLVYLFYKGLVVLWWRGAVIMGRYVGTVAEDVAARPDGETAAQATARAAAGRYLDLFYGTAPRPPVRDWRDLPVASRNPRAHHTTHRAPRRAR